MIFSDLTTFLAEALGESYADVTYAPGPAASTVQQKRTPGRLVFIAIGNGAGLTAEQLFDQPFITIRAYGKQNNYDDAEALAYAIDRALLSVNSNALVGTAKTLYITRTGGPPVLLEFDVADRYAFQCTYITETQTGL